MLDKPLGPMLSFVVYVNNQVMIGSSHQPVVNRLLVEESKWSDVAATLTSQFFYYPMEPTQKLAAALRLRSDASAMKLGYLDYYILTYIKQLSYSIK